MIYYLKVVLNKMDFFKTIKNKTGKITSLATLLVAIGASQVYADEPKDKTPIKRTINGEQKQETELKDLEGCFKYEPKQNPAENIVNKEREQKNLPFLPMNLGRKTNSISTYSAGDLLADTLADIKLCFPEIDDSYLDRIMLTATAGGLALAVNLVSHENAHKTNYEDGGIKAKIHYFRSFKSVGEVSIRPNSISSLFGVPSTKAAGINQQQFNAERGRLLGIRTNNSTAYEQLFRNILILTNKFEAANYASTVYANGHIPGHDVGGYIESMNWRQRPIHANEILASSIAAAALSGASIDSLINVISYLKNPDNKPKHISAKINSLEFFLPDFSYYLTPEGSFYTATITAKVKNKTLQLKNGVGRTGETVEISAYDLNTGKISFHPYVGVSHKRKTKDIDISTEPGATLEVINLNSIETNTEEFGGKVGLGFTINLSRQFALIGDISIAKDDLMTQYVFAQGNKTMVEGGGGLNASGFIWLYGNIN